MEAKIEKTGSALDLDLSSPWEIFYKEIEAMFGMDPEITIRIDRDEYTVRLYICNTDKADALSQLLPMEKEFGNVKVKIAVIPDNDEDTKATLYEKAFRDNPAFEYVDVNGNPAMGLPSTFVIFRKEVVQYFNDSLNDPNRICSTLYQNIAPDIFGADPEVHFCTAYEPSLRMTYSASSYWNDTVKKKKGERIN